MDFYKNSVVWLTGASSGIGEALVPELLKKGAYIIISARREAELDRIFKQYGGDKDRIFVLPFDLVDHASLPKMVHDAISWKGQIDILINNGGISQRAFAHETSLEIEKQIFDVNYFGTVELTRHMIPHMMARKSGHIVVISSVLGKMSVPLRSTYCSSKHALHGYFDALRAELHQANVKVVLVCPGYIKTEVSINALRADGRKHATLDKTQAKGMDADIFSRKMLRKLASGRQEFAIGGIEIIAIYTKRFFPWLVSRITQRLTPVIRNL